MKKIQDLELNNKTVLIRVDFNVPLTKDLKIIDDNRIKESLKTINYCIENNCKIVLLSHLGRIKNKNDLKTNSLKIVSEHLSKLLNKKVLFLPQTKGIEVSNTIKNMKNKDIILLENTRFEDLNDKAESKNNQELAKYWASLGDVFINDAFATSHRSNASNVGITTYIKESAIGFLMQKELDNLLPVINNPKLPLIVILGGSKVNDKIKLIKNLINKADYLLIGGAMAYTFLKAKNIEVGKSLVDFESLNFCKEILNSTNKIILPIDHICSKKIDENENNYIKENLGANDIGLDIGPKTINLFQSYLTKCKTVIWNGPLGYYEFEKYQNGTKKITEIISNLNITSIVGGGDSASLIINLGYKDKFTHISTGGGASLELLSGIKLPGIEAIK